MVFLYLNLEKHLTMEFTNMKKIFFIMFMLSSFVFADKILTTSVGKLNPTAKVIGGYEEPHGVKVTWNLTKGRITTKGNSLDSAEEFMIRIWDKYNQRIDAYASEIFVNKAPSGDEYKVYGTDLNDAKSLDLVFFNNKFNPTKSTFVCYDNNAVPFELENGNVVCANPDTTFKNKTILIYNDENDNDYLIREVKTCKNKEKCDGIKSYNLNTSVFECHTNYYKQISEEKCIPKKNCKKNEKLDEYNSCVSPDSGYVWLNNDKNDLSQRPACEAENERYNENTNECEYKIENSHWIEKSLEYECNKGYVYINGLCEEKVSCKADERYDEENNSCITKPENSHWNQDNDIIWTCDSNYVEINGNCELTAECNVHQKYIIKQNVCIDPPENSKWVTQFSDAFVCNEGYWNNGTYCELKAVCEEGRFNNKNNTCFTKPDNSHWVYSSGKTWACNEGYHEGYESCFICLGETQYNANENACIVKPTNSHWISEGNWVCNENFFKTELNECVPVVSCGFFERYNSYTNECVNKPSDSHWTADNSTNWECDDGYYKTYFDKCEKSNPIDLTNYISFAHDLTFGIGIGNGKDIEDNSTTIFNLEANYNIGAKIGNEFFNVRTQISTGLLYTEFEYSDYIYMDETVYAMAFTFGPNIGFDFWKFSFDYSYLWRYGEKLESITFNDTYSKYKFGFNINEHFNVNVSMISNMIGSTQRLKEFDDNMFSLGLTYRF